MSEHAELDMVDWSGEDGAVYMFQAELPYAASKRNVPLWHDDSVVYRVHPKVTRHTAVGLGAYVVNPSWPGTDGQTGTAGWKPHHTRPSSGCRRAPPSPGRWGG